MSRPFLEENQVLKVVNMMKYKNKIKNLSNHEVNLLFLVLLQFTKVFSDH